MSAWTTPSASPTSARRWWQRLGHALTGPYGLGDDWTVLPGPSAQTEVVLGPGGTFLLDHRRSAPKEVARLAGDLSGHLTASLGTCVTVQPVLVETPDRPVRTEQPAPTTVVTTAVLGAWLRSHPPAWDTRELSQLRGALRSVSGAA